jgi:signal transduction histidine kinase
LAGTEPASFKKYGVIMGTDLKILLLEDVPEDAGLIERALKKDNIKYQIRRVDTSEEFTVELEKHKPDVVLSDHALPQFNSNEALKICRSIYPLLPFILVTGAVSEEFAVKILKLGADDYVLKSNLSRLGRAIRQAIRQRNLESKKIEAEQALKEQNLELIKLNKELDNFVYNISHNLRAPLVSVMGLINVAFIDRTDINNIELYLNKMRYSINKLDTTLKEILDYSRNTRVDIKQETIDLNELINNSFDNLKYLTNFDRIEKKINVDEKNPLVSDSYRLSLIFDNLISNSIKYLDVKKTPNIVEINVSVSDEVTIVYTDNGIGIHPDYQERVFDMFFRASEISEGAGLGLYIVKEALEKLNGSIQMESVLNKWTRFIIRMPNNINKSLPNHL